MKLDKANTMIDGFRDRLAKSQKEHKKLLIENKRLTQDKYRIQTIFQECITQVRNDKKVQKLRNTYRNPELFLDQT